MSHALPVPCFLSAGEIPSGLLFPGVLQCPRLPTIASFHHAAARMFLWTHPNKTITAFRGFRNRVSDLPTVLGNDALASKQNLLNCNLQVFFSMCVCVWLTRSFFFGCQLRCHLPATREIVNYRRQSNDGPAFDADLQLLH